MVADFMRDHIGGGEIPRRAEAPRLVHRRSSGRDRPSGRPGNKTAPSPIARHRSPNRTLPVNSTSSGGSIALADFLLEDGFPGALGGAQHLGDKAIGFGLAGRAASAACCGWPICWPEARHRAAAAEQGQRIDAEHQRQHDDDGDAAKPMPPPPRRSPPPPPSPKPPPPWPRRSSMLLLSRSSSRSHRASLSSLPSVPSAPIEKHGQAHAGALDLQAHRGSLAAAM